MKSLIGGRVTVLAFFGSNIESLRVLRGFFSDEPSSFRDCFFFREIPLARGRSSFDVFDDR